MSQRGKSKGELSESAQGKGKLIGKKNTPYAKGKPRGKA